MTEIKKLSLLLIIAALSTGAFADLQGHWKYEQAYISGNTLQDLSGNGHNGTITGDINLNANPEAMIFDGTENYVSVDDGPLPTQDISILAWVNVTQPATWAGIINYIQDNGSVEHGWILGQVNGAFLFGLSTGTLTYLSANQTFETNQWYHVAGTYDGSEMIIYVNGQPAGSSTGQSGNISYLPSWYRMGQYIDDNEAYFWNGMIAEVAIYDNTLTATEIQDIFSASRSDFGIVNTVALKAGPYVHFSDLNKATVYWQTDTAVPSKIEYGQAPNLDYTVEELTPKTSHQLTIDIKPETQYTYRCGVGDDASRTFEFYSAFDFGPQSPRPTVNPYPSDELTDIYADAAQYIIDSINFTKGVCIDYGCGQGRLAYEISKRSDFKIIGFTDSPTDIAAAREYLDQAGIYGNRITILNNSLASLTCQKYSANLIVSDDIIANGSCPSSADELFRILRPAGGIAMLGQPADCPQPLNRTVLETWLDAASLTYQITENTDGLWAAIDRDPLSGSGQWTHYYANIQNTANSGETRMTDSLKVLWYGQPGPRYITDRHNRPMASLYIDGIVVTPGIHRVMAFDAYNGSRYWDLSIPETTRAAILRDCGWVALANDYAYIAHKQDCLGADLKTGTPTINLTTPTIDDQKLNWGYLALDNDKIYGSGQKPGASLIGHSRAYVDQAYYDYQPIATSNYLFCMDRHTGEISWTYKRAGSSAIVNPAITVAGDYIYFIESRNPTAINDSDGRVTASTLFNSSYEYLIKLNKLTGAEVDSRQVDLPFEHMAYLLYAPDDNLIIALGSQNDPDCFYEQLAFSPSNLSTVWSSSYHLGGTGGSHGEQDQHPCIVGHTLYMRHYKAEIDNNGNTSSFPLSRSNCGTQSACQTHLFGRNGNPYIYQLPTGDPTRLTYETRPGCWINMIPAGGLLLIPESSAGCTCDYPIQTSFSFIPQ